MYKPIQFRSISAFAWIMLSLAFITTLWIGQSAFLQDTTIPVTATEGHTGILGSTAYGLRCPSNLSGIGPDWRGIQIGLSTLDDLKALYEPYGQEPGILNEPPHSSDDPQEDYALTYYISIEGRDIQPELELPGLVEACIINNTIVALSVFAERDPSLPQTPIQLIALMGEPTLTSWDENDKETRMLHWPSDGISAQIYQGMSVWFLYLYPYQESDYLVHWPLSTALLQQPEYVLFPQETVELNMLDYEAIEETLAVSPAWPTRTPHPPDPTGLPAKSIEDVGGLLGSLTGKLRCPINLTGIGPRWRDIQVGVSTLNEWKTQFKPYMDYIQIVTPSAPLGTLTPPTDTYAPYYKGPISLYRYDIVKDLPTGFGACLVGNKIQAFFIYTENITDVPHHVDEIISLLGPVERVSWNEGDQYSRVLHWPQIGISADVSGTGYITGIYYYPYQSGNDRWPMNALLKEITPSLFPGETSSLEQFDQIRQIDLKEIESTVAADPVWPTRTPHVHITVTPSKTKSN